MSGFDPNTPELLANNAAYAAQFADGHLDVEPRRHLAIIACMDSRMNIFEMLGLTHGEAHIIRNAGGLATGDAIRSLVISQQLLGTEEIIVLEHTGCGMLTFQDQDVHRNLVAKTGHDVDIVFHAFGNLEANLRSQVERIRSHPWIKDVPVHGLIYEVETGRLRAAA